MLNTYNVGNERGIFFRENLNSAGNRYNLSILNYDHMNGGVSPDGLSINGYDGVSFSTGSNTRNERMRIAQNGNVGIGTTNPTAKLDVNGNTFIGNLGERRYLKIASKEWPELRFQTPSSNEQIRLGVAHINNTNYGINSGDFYVYSATSKTMPLIVNKNGNITLVNKSGNLGVGTTNIPANYKLAVAGKVISEEVKVQLSSNWFPDYVFKNDYILPSLKEVETYINQNGHLENIPSAEEVEKEGGILIGEMNVKLLEKIEELTLYTIQQEKKIEKFEEKAASQDEKIEMLLKRLEQLENKK